MPFSTCGRFRLRIPARPLLLEVGAALRWAGPATAATYHVTSLTGDDTGECTEDGAGLLLLNSPASQEQNSRDHTVRGNRFHTIGMNGVRATAKSRRWSPS